MTRNYSQKDLRVLYTQSGNICAFPGCNERLVLPETSQDDAVNVSNIAHIVADSRQGPRGREALSDEERQSHPNLVLLCPKHHQAVDGQPHTFSVPVIRQIKQDHLLRIERALPQPQPAVAELVQETIHSTVLPLTHVPAVVYSAPCNLPEDAEAVKKAMVYPHGERGRLFPFALRGGLLFSFDDLGRQSSAFRNVVNWRKSEGTPSQEFWSDDEGHRRYVNLLNRTMYKYAALFGIRYDPDHHRYYYPVNEKGKERVVNYTPLNAGRRDRKVAWCPVIRATNEPRKFWWHLAAGLRFGKTGKCQWCLSIRPERHVTADGEQPLPPDKIGPKVTRLKARMFNDKYLAEVQFWRDVLSGGKPRFIIKVGSQSLICDSTLLTCQVSWPGVPDDEIEYKNQAYEEDLFSLAEFAAALRGDPVDDDNEDEIEEESVD